MKLTSVMAALLVALLAGCAKDSMLASRSEASGGVDGVQVTSPAFKYGKMIPRRYTADGENISPPLNWGQGPTQTKEYVVVVEDPDASGNQPYVHWLVYGIPPSETGLREGASHASESFKQGMNSKGASGYTGADAPAGKPHRYIFQVFALDEPLDLKPGATKKQVMLEMKDHVLLQGQLMGIYQR